MGKTVLFVGGTGLLGEPPARALNEAGFNVRILTRNVDKAREKFDDSFDIIFGDVEDSLALEKALEDCWGVHISLPEKMEPQGVHQVVESAVNQGIQRITYTGGALLVEENAVFPLTKNKLACVEAIKKSGIPYTIFCPAFINETLEMMVQGERAGIIGTKLPPTHMIAAADYGRLVALGYQSEEAVNRKLFMFGPEEVDLFSALKKYCAALHPEVKKVSAMPVPLAKLFATVSRNKDFKLAADVFGFFQKVGDCGDPEESNRILGKPATTFDEWLAEKTRSQS